MTDICKCTGEACPLKDNCVRHVSILPDVPQAFFADIHYKEGNCQFYIPLEDGTDVSNMPIS